MEVKGKRIYVGLSGGVDSAVSAALLQQAGATVVGVFIKGWYPPGLPCTWAEDRRDAMRVAAHLRIPFKTLDASAEYKKSVIDYLISEYRAGRTPNPDIMCNRDVKFGVFYRYAKAHGADAIATGHYLSGEKDQRYFLWAVPREIIQDTVFPVGCKSKKEVRALAAKFKMPVASKKDSQGICFLGSVSIEDFLRQELGTDNPALLYTLGQRVSQEGLLGEGGTKQGPWYVVGKNVREKKIHVAKTRKPTGTTIHFSQANVTTPVPQHIVAQYRYRGPRVAGSIEGGQFTSRESLPEVPVPGQSIVFYKGDEQIGGGIIDE